MSTTSSEDPFQKLHWFIPLPENLSNKYSLFAFAHAIRTWAESMLSDETAIRKKKQVISKWRANRFHHRA
jgi:hypothetical protein